MRRLNLRLVGLGICLMSSSIALSQGLEDRARDILQKLELRGEWRPGFEERSVGSSAMLSSNDMQFAFFGASRKFQSFQWIARLDQIRKRGEYLGSALRTNAEVAARARGLLARLRSVDNSWQIKRYLGADDPEQGRQQEFQGGVVGAEFERVVNGLPAVGHGAMVWFDSEDGKPVYVAINDPNTTFGSTAGMMSALAAEARAREHATDYLRRNLSAEDAERLIGGFPNPANTPVELIYGSVDEGLDGVTEPYASRRETPPEYVVNLGSVTVLIHAVTGECLGGGVTQSASAPPRGKPPAAGRGGSRPVVGAESPDGGRKSAPGSSPALFYVGVAAAVALAVHRWMRSRSMRQPPISS